MDNTDQQNKVSRRKRPFALRSKKSFVVAGLVVLVSVAAVGKFTTHDGKTDAATSDPGFQAIIPESRSISELGGWKRVSPPKTDPVYAYADKVSGVEISVSEQQIPKSFNGSIDSNVASIAEKFNAMETFTADKTKVHIGTSAKGPQSLIFSKNDLLILIKSQKKVDQKTWISYITALKTSDETMLPKY